MTIELKCPFCGKELKDQWVGQYVAHEYFDCPKCKMNGNPKLWQALIQAKQDLEKSKERCSAWEKKVLDCQMKALALNEKLEIAKSALRQINLRLVIAPEFVAREALEQIEHKEKTNDK